MDTHSEILQGDCEIVLGGRSSESVDLVFTSPPYFNARPEYAEYPTYDDYLKKMRRVIRECHRVLGEGRFFVINTSPVLVSRESRSEQSTRLAIPFDLHRIFTDEGFEFIDDIIWVKPEGAGWATSRGRRFAADRHPLQYKAVPVTEYVLVYRKKTDRLIDWNIRSHHDQAAVEASKIKDGYEVTNVWKINPANDPQHPAVFPIELADKVISYYSFKGDVVLDPFAGTGTTGESAAMLGRKYLMIEQDAEYYKIIKDKMQFWTETQ